MFSIYLYNWATDYDTVNDNYNLVTDETLALTIPTDGPEKLWLGSATLKAETNKAESFDISIDPGSEYYNAFLPMKTWCRIDYDGINLFYGRVKSVSNSTLLQRRSIHMEGVYSTLLDSPVEGLEEDLQPNQTAADYLFSLLANHNNYVENGFKHFNLGDVTVTLDGESKKRGATSWSTTMSEIEKLIDETGGYVRARRENGGTFLDWTKYYFRDLGDGKRPKIQLRKNLIDISKSPENTDIFTRVIPIGHKSVTSDSKESSFVYLDGSRYIKVSDVPGSGVSIDDEFHKASDFLNAEEKYGIIYKTVNFANASTPGELRNYCLDWIKNNYYGIVHSFSVKAVDMHMIGEDEPQIFVGDCIDVEYPEFDKAGAAHMVTRKLIVKAIQYDLLHPEATTYTVGVPCDAIDFEYGTKNKKKSASKAAEAAEEQRVSSGGGGGKTEITWEMVRAWLQYYYYSCRDADIVDWTETRWVKENPDGTSTSYRDPLPRNSFNNYGEHYGIKKVETGQTGDEKLYTNEKVYTYMNVRRPGGGSTVRARIMGRYQIDARIAKPGTTASHLNSSFVYGVCLTTDGYVYTFQWNNAFTNALEQGKTEERTYASFFEIKKTSSSGEVAAEDLYTAGANGTDTLLEVEGPTEWKSYQYTDSEGNVHYKTTAMIATDEGWAGFGNFIKDDNGKWIPAIKLDDKGWVTATDLALPEIPSFSAKVASIDNLIADRAVIGELRAYVAAFGGENALLGDDGTGIFLTDDEGNVVTDEHGTWQLKKGTTFYVNANNAGGAAGMYYVQEYTNPETGRTEKQIVMKTGGEIFYDDNGVRAAYWHDKNVVGGMITEKINEGDPDDPRMRSVIYGNHILVGDENTRQTLQQANAVYSSMVGNKSDENPTGFVFEFDEEGNVLLDAEGKPIMHGLGSGTVVWRNGSGHGIWDDGNLTGGIMTKMINDQTETYIRGDRIMLGDGNTKQILTQATELYGQIVGTYHWEKDADGTMRVTGVEDGAGTMIYGKDGTAHGIWHNGNLTGGTITTMINDETVEFIKGDRIIIGDDNTRQSLTRATEEYAQVVGKYVWETGPDGKRHVKGLDGSGAYVTKDGAQFGLWHEGNLDGGIMVKKINNETVTTIKGDHINIGENAKSVSLTSAIKINSNGFLSTTNDMWIQGDLYVTKNGTKPGAVLANRFTVNSGGGILFSGSHAGESSVAITRTDANAIMNKSQPHIKITGPKDGKYTLWYLPASQTSYGDTTEGWINCGNFSSAADLKGNWVSGKPTYLKILNGDTTAYTVKFGEGGEVTNINVTLDLFAGSTNPTYYNKSTKQVLATIEMKTGGYAGPNGYVWGNTQYSKDVYVDATPAYNGGWDAASDAVKLSNPVVGDDEQQNVTIYRPAYNGNGASRTRYTGQLGFFLREGYSGDDSYISRYEGSTMVNYAHLKHGTRTKARKDAWEKAVSGITWPDENTGGNILYVSYLPTETAQYPVKHYFWLDSKTNENIAYVRDSATIVAQQTHNWYKTGWTTAGKAVRDSMPEALAANADAKTSFTIKLPSDTAQDVTGAYSFRLTKDSTPGTSGYARLKSGYAGGEDVLKIDISNWYTSGWSTGISKITWPKTKTASDVSNQLIVQYYATATDSKPTSNIYTMYIDDTYAYIRTSVYNMYARIDNPGWADGVGNITWPGKYNTSKPSQMTVSYASTAAKRDSHDKSKTYILSDSGDNAVQLKDGSTIVAFYQHNKHSTGYALGWKTGISNITWPAKNTTSATATVSYKTESSKTAADGKKTFTISDSTNDIVVLKDISSVVVAQYKHGKYTSGLQNAAVTMDSLSWSKSGNAVTYNNTLSAKAYNSSNSAKTASKTKTLYLTATDNDWAYVREDTASGTVVMKLQHNQYSNGINTTWLVPLSSVSGLTKAGDLAHGQRYAIGYTDISGNTQYRKDGNGKTYFEVPEATVKVTAADSNAWSGQAWIQRNGTGIINLSLEADGNGFVTLRQCTDPNNPNAGYSDLLYLQVNMGTQESHTYKGTIYRAQTSDVARHFYDAGTLYFKNDAGGYTSIANDKYWFYSDTDLGNCYVYN